MNKGYTLIELLVAAAIFFLLVAGPTGLFITSLRNQTRFLAMREVIDNSSYVLEYVSRFLRMARKDLNGTCISQSVNYENPAGISSNIRFINSQGLCQEFSLDTDRMQERKSTDDTAVNLGSGVYLTSDDLKVTLLKFQLAGQGQGDNLQPRVTILFEIRKEGVLGSPETKLQTTISQRNLDLVY
ncbi:MAG: prepilin-type N-terminal cleavage/methylation domain-containing protein [Patescibacteria group bacterium]|nr:prepilin-type N-terminal cleavage/methylation domain-containing protein [Patescibacteria group bacterium]